MTNMPEMKAAKAQLEKIQEQYDKEYKTMVQEYQTKLQKYEQEAPTAGEALNETRSKEMQDMGSRIQQYQQTAGKDLQQKEFRITSYNVCYTKLLRLFCILCRIALEFFLIEL